MESSQAESRNGDHDAIQDDEISLVVHDRIAPSVCHLRDTEDATHENGQVSDEEATDEDLEFGILQQFHCGWCQVCAAGADAANIVGHQTAEDEEGDDLPDDTGHHEVIAGLLQGRTAVGCGGDATSGTLEDEGQEITENEDPGVVPGWDAREFRTDFQYAVLESEVDASS